MIFVCTVFNNHNSRNRRSKVKRLLLWLRLSLIHWMDHTWMYHFGLNSAWRTEVSGSLEWLRRVPVGWRTTVSIINSSTQTRHQTPEVAGWSVGPKKTRTQSCERRNDTVIIPCLVPPKTGVVTNFPGPFRPSRGDRTDQGSDGIGYFGLRTGSIRPTLLVNR